MTPLDHEAIRNALQYALTRSARICYNMNSETLGHERGPDCARRIEYQAPFIIEEALSIAGIKPPAAITIISEKAEQ